VHELLRAYSRPHMTRRGVARQINVGTKVEGPDNATISAVTYNTIAQALTADNKPDPNGCGRVKLFDWIRRKRPALTSYPSLASSWARPASSALSRPAPCLPPTAMTWTSPPLSPGLTA